MLLGELDDNKGLATYDDAGTWPIAEFAKGLYVGDSEFIGDWLERFHVAFNPKGLVPDSDDLPEDSTLGEPRDSVGDSNTFDDDEVAIRELRGLEEAERRRELILIF